MLLDKSLRFRLILAFTSVTLFMVVIAMTSQHYLAQVYDDFEYITSVSMEKLKTMASIRNHSNATHRYLLRVDSAPDDATRAEFKAKWFKNVEERELQHKAFDSLQHVDGEDKY